MKRAEFIGHQDLFDDKPAIALFNVIWPGNVLDKSTVKAETIVRLGIKELVDRQGNRLLTVPRPSWAQTIGGN